jgi:hypothetical protein
LSLSIEGLEAKAGAMKDDIAACAVSLTPDVTIMHASQNLKKSWLRLVTEKTYETAKQQIKTSGEVDLLDIIGAKGDFNYDQFNDKRREYLNLDTGNIQDERAVSVFRQTLPPKAGEHFIQCVNLAATGGSGLRAWFSDETSQYANLHVKFRSAPGGNVAFRISTRGGTGVPAVATLPHDGETQYTMSRAPGATEIRVILTSTSPAGLTDSAISVRPASGVTPPKPTFVTEQVWSLAVIDPPDQSKPCQYAISNRELKVMAYDMQGSALALKIRGRKTVPGPGIYPISASEQSDYAILGIRSLSDLELGPSSEVLLVGPSGATTALIKTAATSPGCPAYKLKFASSKVIVRQPQPVYVSSPEVYSETLEYKRSGDYPRILGDIGCPQCGDLYAADLVRKLSRPVSRIEMVAFEKQTGSPQWYRCYSVSPACGTNGETTATYDRQSGSCVGKSSCVSWRYSTDGNEATDVYTLKYRAKECLRYCPP